MDATTQLALRAIVSGLHHAGTIDQRHISKIVEALVEVDSEKATKLWTNDRAELRQLCMDIARDGQVECPIKQVEPPANWNH